MKGLYKKALLGWITYLLMPFLPFCMVFFYSEFSNKRQITNFVEYSFVLTVMLVPFMMAGFVYWLARKSAKEAVAYPTLAQHFSEQREMFRYLLKVGFFCGAVMILMFFHGEPVASAIGGMLLGAISFVVAARLCIISIRRILTLWKMP